METTNTDTTYSASSSLSNSFVDEDNPMQAAFSMDARRIQLLAVSSDAPHTDQNNNTNNYQNIINETYSALSHKRCVLKLIRELNVRQIAPIWSLIVCYSKSKMKKKEKKAKSSSNPNSPRRGRRVPRVQACKT
jgi:hypothetical protein